MIMHSHGWGGSRSTSASDSRRSPTPATACCPSTSAASARAAARRTSRPDRRGPRRPQARPPGQQSPLGRAGRAGRPPPRGDRRGYGGGYQFLAAFEELRRTGKPVFDALAPEITWNDLNQQPRARGRPARRVGARAQRRFVALEALPLSVYKALVEGAATGTWPDGSVPGTENLVKFFKKNGPHGTSTTGAGSTSPCCSARARPTRCSTFSRASTTGGPPSPGAPAQHLRRLQRRSRAARGVPPRRHRSPPTRAREARRRQLRGPVAEVLRRGAQGLRPGLRRLRQLPPRHPGGRPASPSSSAARRTPEAASGPSRRPTPPGARSPPEIAAGPIRVAGDAVPHRHVTTLTPGSRAFYGLAHRHLARRRPAGAGQRAAALRATAGHRRTHRDRPAGGGGGRAEGQTPLSLASPLSDAFVGMSSRTPGPRDARRHEGAPAGRGLRS